MGTTLNAVEPLGEPFRSVDEQVFVMPRDGHNEVANRLFKIIVMIEGHCLHEIDDLGRVPFRTGDVVIIPRICRQRYWPLHRRGSERLHALRLVFDPLKCPAYPADHRPVTRRGDVERDLTACVRHHFQEVRHLSPPADVHLRTLLTTLRQEAEQQQTGHRFRVTALCTSLVVQLARCLSRDAGQRDHDRHTGRAHVVLHTREFLLKNLQRTLHLDEVAEHLAVSQEHLARVFKQQTGQTVFGYLQDLRLERAKTFLIGSDKSIGEIATLTGYSSLALFSRTFRRHTGVSPLQYRQERWDQAVERV